MWLLKFTGLTNLLIRMVAVACTAMGKCVQYEHCQTKKIAAAVTCRALAVAILSVAVSDAIAVIGAFFTSPRGGLHGPASHYSLNVCSPVSICFFVVNMPPVQCLITSRSLWAVGRAPEVWACMRVGGRAGRQVCVRAALCARSLVGRTIAAAPPLRERDAVGKKLHTSLRQCPGIFSRSAAVAWRYDAMRLGRYHPLE